LNFYSIGIELLAIGSKNDMAPYLLSDEYDSLNSELIGFTDKQYESLKALVSDISERHDTIIPNRSHIIGHDEYSYFRTDPGELFEWDRIIPFENYENIHN
jgi:N-acetyl-anhydromuramyl-L-alanine amidase AmpD